MGTPFTLRHVASSWALVALNAAIAFFLTPFLLAGLGPSRFGVWASLGVITLSLSFSELGVGTSVQRWLAEALGRGAGASSATAREIVGQALHILTWSLLVVAVTTALVAAMPPGRWRAAAGPAELAGTVVLLGLAAGIALFSGPALAALTAEERWLERNLLVAGRQLAWAGLAVAALSAFGPSLPALAAAVTGASVVLVAGAWRAARGYAARRAPRLTPLGRSMLAYGATRTAAGLLELALLGGGTVLVSVAVGPAAAAAWAVVARLLEMLRSFVVAFTQLLLPRTARLWGTDDREEAARVLRTAARATGVLVAAPVAALLVAGPAFLGAWVPEVAPAASRVLRLLAVPFGVSLLLLPGVEALYAIGRAAPRLRALAAAAALFLLAGVPAAWQWGLPGVATALAAALVVGEGAVLVAAQMRHLPFATWRVAAETALGAAAGAAPAALVAALVTPRATDRLAAATAALACAAGSGLAVGLVVSFPARVRELWERRRAGGGGG